MIRHLILIPVLTLTFTSTLSAQALGTPPRQELEIKLPYEITEDLSIIKLSQKIQKNIAEQLPRNKFKLPKHLKKPYKIEKNFRTYIYKDIYFDTPNQDLRKTNAIYRLRYRWKSPIRYYFHQKFPYLSATHPIRAEVQFKNNYHYNPETQEFTATETRFEFRNTSEPFIQNQDAPPPPWTEKDYIPIAQSGKFRHHQMLPHHQLNLHLNLNLNLKLQPTLTLITQRTRTHLTIKNNWGTGPNPKQAFIITIDKSQDQEKAQPPRLEIEVEIDRNITTALLQNPSPKNQALLALLKQDQAHLTQIIQETLAAENLPQIPPPPKPKYQTFTTLNPPSQPQQSLPLPNPYDQTQRQKY